MIKLLSSVEPYIHGVSRTNVPDCLTYTKFQKCFCRILGYLPQELCQHVNSGILNFGLSDSHMDAMRFLHNGHPPLTQRNVI